VWKWLWHPNIVPFLGVPTEMPPFQIICDWMENHSITEYARKNPGVGRVDLVSIFSPAVTIAFERSNVKFRSCGTWRMAFTISTRAI
jgi:hypothetical protein